MLSSARRWQGPLFVVVTVAAVFAAVFVFRPPSAEPGTTAAAASGGGAPAVGTLAPDFTATALDGNPVSLHDYRGRPVWLVFGASWCAGCRAEAPDVQAAAAQAQRDGISVLAIYVAEDRAAVKAYTERLGLAMVNVPDPSSTVADAYAARGVPCHYFIDAGGVVRKSVFGLVTQQTAADGLQAARHAA